MRVNLRDYPSYPKTYDVTFPLLNGGLNLREVDYRLNNNESPEMRNMWWMDGLLQCRDGQAYLYNEVELGQGFACAQDLFHGRAFVHIGSGIYYFIPAVSETSMSTDIQETTERPVIDIGITSKDKLDRVSRIEVDSEELPRNKYRVDPKTGTVHLAVTVSAGSIVTVYYFEKRINSLTSIITGVNEERGTFFRYSDWLMYKNPGGFYKISYDDRTDVFSAVSLADDAYTPVIVVNADPETGSGDMYQPENRLSAKKTVKYNAKENPVTVNLTGDGLSMLYSIGYSSATYMTKVKSVYIDNALIPATEYEVNLDAGQITFTKEPPKKDSLISINICIAVRIYKLPVDHVDSVDSIIVDGVDFVGSSGYYLTKSSNTFRCSFDDAYYAEKHAGWTYELTCTVASSTNSWWRVVGTAVTADGMVIQSIATGIQAATLETSYGITNLIGISMGDIIKITNVQPCDIDLVYGTVTFKIPPSVTDPPTNNTVEITYSKANDTAYSALMDCKYAIVAGGNTDLCMMLAGCKAQPNAVFWNSNDSLSMNPSYWPVSYYNLVGDTNDPVSGFAKQYGTLLVLKEHSVGSLAFNVDDVDGRNSINFTYTNINSRVGCDLPWTIQLVENNVTFANTYRGVCTVLASSAAFENNVICISDKVNGDESSTGLLYDLRHSGTDVCSVDDDTRYWIVANGHAYLWDYEVSGYKDPSWFFQTNINAVAFFNNDSHEIFHLNHSGFITRFHRGFYDYEDENGEPIGIDKFYRFPAQFFGSYDRLKDILYLLISVRSDTDTTMKVQYITDYEKRYDLTPISTRGYYRLAPRNLMFRNLSCARFAFVAKRKPGCRHVRHFCMTVENSEPLCDMSIATLQIFYRFTGKER